ncbi:MAG: hypothetical protein K0R75_351 [Paenibacillaceae bacterium]|jgi:hypothetical protein|nr:hypothetical protein [Paenibacillaceae bacterium]
MPKTFRPPAVPLITVDPYLNIWSAANQLFDNETKHWTGKNNGMVGMAKIDGQVWRFMGGYDRRSDFETIDCPTMNQVSLQVRALSSIYTFEAAGIRLTVDFTTPLLPDDLDILARPASYVTLSAQSIDGKPHQVELYYDVSGELCVDYPLQEVIPSRQTLDNGAVALKMGTTTQDILRRSGDDIRIDWGYVYLTASTAHPVTTLISDSGARARFVNNGALDRTDDSNFPRAILDGMPILATLTDLGTVGSEARSTYIIVAYDDILSIEYFGTRLPGYWRRTLPTAESLLLAAHRDHADLMARSAAFNERLEADALASGGRKYADMLALAYRQSVAAHKIVADENGDILFLSKENLSNGCINTVDVSYPSIPLYLLYNPELVKGLMRGIFRYAASDAWPYDFAPHDIGRYPLANGQVYGMAMHRQMPIEECGNMLLMAATLAKAEGNADFAAQNWELLSKWCGYLRENGMDPGNQLCTDDFGGHLAHNANLSIKAIVAIAAYGLLCGMRGDEGAKEAHLAEAAKMAQEWEKMAREGDHYRLAFDSEGSWSLKYNLVWDTMLGLNVFPPEIRKREVAYYIRQRNRYGTPLDNRKTYTKSDWLLWSAAMAESQEDFAALIEPLWLFQHETGSRVPTTDWYYTIDGRMTGFVNRSVVGGLFIKVLADKWANAGGAV